MLCKKNSLINIKIEIVNEHNQKPLPENNLNRQKMYNNLKRKAVDDIFIRPSKMLHSKLKNYDIENITSRGIILIKINTIMLDIQNYPNYQLL